MITRLRIQNFKAWKDTQSIRLAPITVFFGANSAGKTSLHQLLLMLKQTAQSSDRQRVLHPGGDQSIVDLGTVQDLVFAHQGTARIEFEIEWSLNAELRVKDTLAETEYRGERMSFAAKIAPRDGKLPSLVVENMRYQLGVAAEGGLAVQMIEQPNFPGRYEIACDGPPLVRQRGRAWPLPAPIRFYGFPDEVRAYFQNADFVADLTLAFEQMLSGLHYLGPLREYPRRTYMWSGERPEHVGTRGASAVEALLAARDRFLNRRPKAKKEPFERVVARWLKAMGLIEEFEVHRVAPHLKEYEVRVRTAGSPHMVSLMDVGFGVSQVLPVLVECFYVPSGATIIFEQPEIHLHPRVQAKLADLFIEAIHMREAGKSRGVQLIIESHSEHFLRRLQLGIAEEKLKPEEAALYFCEPGSEGSRIHELQLDLFGNIDNWPDSFFGDELGDLAAMNDAAMQRSERTRS
ncbi:MAG: DUF3696 domain-containing protein [Acidobacteria bacterium]|nr:DUF3696 domain-containing protein [Acidobacteriota bacterium]